MPIWGYLVASGGGGGHLGSSGAFGEHLGRVAVRYGRLGNLRGAFGEHLERFEGIWAHLGVIAGQVLADAPDVVIIECVTSFLLEALKPLQSKYRRQFWGLRPPRLKPVPEVSSACGAMSTHASQRTRWALPHELDPAFRFVVLLETLTEDQDNMVKHITGGGPTLRYKTLRYTESKSSK